MRIQSRRADRTSRVSVITYDDISRVVIENQSPDPALMSRITYMGHGTNFEKPLSDAYRLAKRYESQSDRFVLLFLTDGTANYPNAAVSQFISDRNLFSKVVW